MPACTTPELWPVWCAPTRSSRSSTVTSSPGRRRRSSRAVARPRRPAPTTTRSDVLLALMGPSCRPRPRRSTPTRGCPGRTATGEPPAMSEERDDPATRDDDQLGGGGPTDLATGGELSETPGGSGIDIGG